MVNNFLMAGKLGDFLHAMSAVKHLSEKNGIPANVYMYDIGWEYGIDNTFRELKPILESQEYIQSLRVLQNYELDPIQTPQKNKPVSVYDIQLCKEKFIDLGGYIRSSWLYKSCWTELYSKTFEFETSTSYAWLSYFKKDERFEGKVLIHRRYNPARLNNQFPYEELVEKHGNNVMFVGASETDYLNFPLKDKLEFCKIDTLDEWFTAINSCYMTISNLTAPTVISHALDKLRIIELPDSPDAIHCMGEEKFSNNVHWYLNNTVKHMGTTL